MCLLCLKTPGVPETVWCTLSAYKEKMKEMSMLSLICSCFYSQPHPNSIYQYGDMEVKPINKRASGQSFEVILKAPSDLSPDRPQSLSSPPKKKDMSLDELQRRLEAAEERRKVGEHSTVVTRPLFRTEACFSSQLSFLSEKLNYKMEVNKENREAYLNALKERLREKARARRAGAASGALWLKTFSTTLSRNSTSEEFWLGKCNFF
ncbi:STMN3 protein, partial [Atractosteus spatula]|nr:STMN3 protein [Atractosteus spatula]